MRRVQYELRDMLRACKDTYRRKLEAKLQQNNVRDVWTGMKQITGCKVSGRQSSGSLKRANELNRFFNRFNSQPSVVSRPPLIFSILATSQYKTWILAITPGLNPNERLPQVLVFNLLFKYVQGGHSLGSAGAGCGQIFQVVTRS